MGERQLARKRAAAWQDSGKLLHVLTGTRSQGKSPVHGGARTTTRCMTHKLLHERCALRTGVRKARAARSRTRSRRIAVTAMAAVMGCVRRRRRELLAVMRVMRVVQRVSTTSSQRVRPREWQHAREE